MSQQSFSRAPGSQFQPTPPRSGLSSPSAFFPSSLDPFSNSTNESPTSSPVDFRTTFSGGVHSPALSPGTGGLGGPGGGQSHNPSFGILDNARPYPLVERRSFRDASSTGDVVVSRQELLANGNNLGSAGAGAIGEQRRQGSVGPGAIGEARRAVTPSQTQEEAALNLPPGVLDSLAAPSNDSEGGGGGQQQVKSRPSSFILDVLPQSRERGFAGGAGSITPSLSLDSVSQPPSTSSTSDVPFLHSPNNLAPVPHHASAFFQNPNSASSTTSLVSNNGGGGGLNVFSNSRSSSPGPLDLANPSNASSSYDSLAHKVNNLESTVSDLSTLLATEFRGLREEVGFLRSLVYQQQQQQSQHRPSFDHRQSNDRETDSPLLTLRSPSPHHSSAFPQPIPLSRGPSYHGGSNHSNSTLLASTSPQPPPLSPHSAPMNFFQPPLPPATAQERFRNNSIDEKKDEQIKLLTQQVNSLTSTVSNLLSSNSNGLHGGSAGVGGGPMSVGMTSRQMSLPVSSSAGNSNEVVSGWKRDLLNGNGSGLGVSAPGGSLMGGKRSISQGGAGGLGRSASLRSASSSQLPGGSSSIGGLRMEQGVRQTFSR